MKRPTKEFAPQDESRFSKIACKKCTFWSPVLVRQQQGKMKQDTLTITTATSEDKRRQDESMQKKQSETKTGPKCLI